MTKLKTIVSIIVLSTASFISGIYAGRFDESHLKRYCGDEEYRASLGISRPAAELRAIRKAASATSNRFDAIGVYLTRHSGPVIERALAAPFLRKPSISLDEIHKLDCLMIEAGLDEVEQYDGSDRLYVLEASGGLTATRYVYLFAIRDGQPIFKSSKLQYMGL